MPKTAKKATPVDRRPWEQQEKETVTQYEAFSAFRDMPPAERSKRDVAKNLGKHESLIYRWASGKNWNDRVREYDAYLERLALDETARQVTAMHKRQIGISMKMQEVGLKALQNLVPEMLKPNEVRLLLKLALEMESSNRLADLRSKQARLPPTPSATPQSGNDDSNGNSSIADDWIAAVMAADNDENEANKA